MTTSSRQATTPSPETLLEAYRLMKTIRTFEECLSAEFAAERIPGAVHLYTGQEACAVGVCLHLSEDDCIVSTHRGHGHCIAKGMDVGGMMAEVFGRASGVCRGKGGSMHVADLDTGMLGANGIVGAGPPIACGAALAARCKGHSTVAVAFIGDGASNQGSTLESLNLACVWDLPVIFVVEDNGYAETTASSYAIGAESNAARARGFGIPAIEVDGGDFFAMDSAAAEAVARARAGGGPTLLDCKVTRYRGHFEGDAQTYRAEGEVEQARRENDCIRAFVRRVTTTELLEREQLAAIDRRVASVVEDALAAARAAPDPDPTDLMRDVYVSTLGDPK